MEIRLLGSGGFMPTDRRETACALVRDGDAALALDAGTGARRLFLEPALLEGADRLHVLLTHFHLDHTVGLVCAVALDLPVEVWGAGKALEGTPTTELVERLLSSPFAAPGFAERVAAVHELEPGHADVAGFDVRTRIQHRHANPTLAVRIGDELAWCTDTAYDEDNAEFARGTRVLAHEAFHAGDATEDASHTAAGEAARLAAAAGVERLVLIHVNPELEDDEELLRHAAPQFADTVVGHDGLTL